MAKTVFTGLRVTGDLEVTGRAALGGGVIGPLTGVSLSKADSYALAADEKGFYVGAAFSAASKTLTLGLGDGQVCLVVNEGETNAFTLKNVSGDTGFTVAAGKAVLVRASATADASAVTLLNDGDGT